MSYQRKLKRKQISFVVSAILFITICGLIIGFDKLGITILFFLPFLLLLPTGPYYLLMKTEGKKQYILSVLWMGFVFAVTALVGITVDPKAQLLGWDRKLLVTGAAWVVSSLVIFIGTPVYAAIYRFWRNG